LPSPYPLHHLRGNALRDLPYLAPQLEATPFLEYETMQLETYFGQPDLMFHAKAVSPSPPLGNRINQIRFSPRPLWGRGAGG
jgi:hypothetical protein